MSETKEIERIFAELVDGLGGFAAAVDPIGEKFGRNFEFRAVIMGRNLSMRTYVPPGLVRKECENVVRELANAAMKRAFEIAARKEEEANGNGK